MKKQGPQAQSSGLGEGTSSPEFCGRGDTRGRCEGPRKDPPQRWCSTESRPPCRMSAPRLGEDTGEAAASSGGAAVKGSLGAGAARDINPITYERPTLFLLPAWCLLSRWVRPTLMWPSS